MLIDAERAPSKGASRDEFSEQRVKTRLPCVKKYQLVLFLLG